jgi:hypothetical protein
MRRMTLIRCGVASLVLGGMAVAGMVATGCGGDDNGAKGGGGDDSGTDGTTTQPTGDDGPAGGDDGSPGTRPDGSAGGDAADAGPPAPVHGKVLLVHASAFAPALRFCYGSVNGDAGAVTIVPGVSPAPNTALGVPPGTGGPAADTSVDLADRTLEIYAINAAALTSLVADGGPELTCDKLIGDKALPVDAGGLASPNVAGEPLQAGIDYWDIGRLPAGTLADGTTTLLAVTGCAPGETTTPGYNCPMPYDVSTGNLSLSYARLDTTTPLDGGSIGAQFAYASTPFASDSTLAGGAAAVAGFYVTTLVTPEAGAPADGGDAAVEAAAPVPMTVTRSIALGVTNGVPPALSVAPTALVPVSGLTFDGNSGFFVDGVTVDGGPTSNPVQVGVPFPSIQAISAPSADAGIFANGVGYVFVLVGDPDPNQPTFIGDAGQFNLFKAHILAFPTNPPFGN